MVAGRRSKKLDSLNAYDQTGTMIDPSKKVKPNSSETVNMGIGNINNYKEYVPDDNHALEVRTLAGNTFRNLFDTLKAVLNEANIIFTEKGLKLAAVDTQQLAFIHLFIESASFEFYHCQKKVVLGVDIEKLYKSIRTNKLNDLMCFVYKKDNPGYLEISYENFQKKTRVTDQIKLLTLNEYNIYDEIEHKRPPEMDSQTFQNICREMAGFHATFMEIKIVGDELIFSNVDGDTKRCVVIKITNSDDPSGTIDNEQWQNHEDDVCGVFPLKFLKSFAKAANLSPRVRLYLKNDSPIICEYSVSGLGTLKYVLAPTIPKKSLSQ